MCIRDRANFGFSSLWPLAKLVLLVHFAILFFALVVLGIVARLCVTRSTRHMFVQVIDDVKGVTLASASTMEAELRAADLDKTAKAKRVGELVAERAKAAGVEAVVFDRGGNKYHGRVAAVADGAREGGLAL